jgi:glycosyltransferase involved in cell wall biosynthesis
VHRRRESIALHSVRRYNGDASLGSVADLVAEIVVVDTGSTDRTCDIARRFGAHVHDFPWQDDFAASRTESLRHATGDWVLWLDGDERLAPEHKRRLAALLAAPSSSYSDAASGSNHFAEGHQPPWLKSAHVPIVPIVAVERARMRLGQESFIGTH